MRIAVWFSCGAASAVAAKRTIERYGKTASIRVLNNPVLEEDEDNQRFLKDIEAWIGQKIEQVTNSKWPSYSAVEVWNKRKFMSGPHGAPCTLELKKAARQQWENHEAAFEHWSADLNVLGFTFDEIKRHQRFIKSERTNVLPILIEEGITKADCFKILKDAGLKLPRVYEMGYPNANCIGCVKATSPTYWNHVRKMHPGVFALRAEQSRQLGARLVRVRGERIFLDQLDPNFRGQPMKTMEVECGIFCEEEPA